MRLPFVHTPISGTSLNTSIAALSASLRRHGHETTVEYRRKILNSVNLREKPGIERLMLMRTRSSHLRCSYCFVSQTEAGPTMRRACGRLKMRFGATVDLTIQRLTLELGREPSRGA